LKLDNNKLIMAQQIQLSIKHEQFSEEMEDDESFVLMTAKLRSPF